MNRKLVEEFFDRYSPVNSAAVKDTLNAKLDRLGLDGVSVIEVDYDEEGHIFVTFSDEEKGELDVTFHYDIEDGAYAVIEDEDEEYAYVINLDALLPPVESTVFGDYINMADSTWMNASFFYAILTGCTEDPKEVTKSENPTDPLFGFHIGESRGTYVIRGGKKVKLAIVRKKRRKLMSGAQRSSIRAAVRKRAMRKSTSNRKRKRSLSIRKRMNLKKPKLNRNQKIAGGANRKR
jgi:hypothetical protein